jgi:uncharacterized repeat protein (TIGR01451 family)
VTVSGAGFNQVTEVTFGGVRAVYQVLDSVRLAATVPQEALTGPLALRSAGSQAGSGSVFVVAPRVTGFAPLYGNEGQSIQVTGANFEYATAVRFGNVAAAFQVTAPGQLVAYVPRGAITAPLTVVNLAGEGRSAQPFSVPGPGPLLLQLDPAIGRPGDTIVLRGLNFLSVTRVSFPGANAPFQVTASSQISATVPSGASNGPIIVASQYGSSTSAIPFTVLGLAPVITDFAPASGQPGTSVRLDGYNFIGTTAVMIGGAQASFQATADTQIHAVVPPSATNGPIVVRNPRGEGASRSDFMISGAQPRLFSIIPAQGLPGSMVTINGENLSSSVRVQFNGTNAQFQVTAPTQIQAMVPPNASSGLIAVSSSAGTGLSPYPFTVIGAAPVINRFEPGTGGSGTPVVLTGANFVGATSVRFGGAAAQFAVTSDTQISTAVPVEAVTGAISVSNAAGEGRSAGLFYLPPAIQSFQPSQGQVGQSVTLSGRNFTAATTVGLGSVPCVFEVLSLTNLVAVVPTNAVSGSWRVTTPAGIVASVATFAVLPSLDSFAPAFGAVGSEVILEGAGFTNIQAVTFNGVTAAFRTDGLNRIRATVPATALDGPLAVRTQTGTAASTTGFVVTGDGNLRIRFVNLPSQSDPHAAFAYQVVALNEGPRAAASVVVTNVLPASMHIRSATNSVGNSEILPRMVVSRIPLLAQNQEAFLRIEVEPTLSGQHWFQATVAGAGQDPQREDNVATAWVVVATEQERTLSIALEPRALAVALRWPTSAIPWKLQSAQPDAQPWNWSPVTSTPEIVGSSYQVLIPYHPLGGVYRLKTETPAQAPR